MSRRATPEEAAWIAERARLAAEVKATEAAIDLLDARILESAGDVGVLDAPGWRLSVSDRKGSPRWRAIAESLAPGGVPADLVTAHTGSPTRYLGWRATKESK